MNRKIIWISAIIVCLLFLTVLIINFSGEPLKKGLDEQSKPGEESYLLKDAVALEKLFSDRSAKAEGKLSELASKKDAVGYYASLELADRYSTIGKDPIPYYKQALELYDTSDVRKKLAYSLQAQGNKIEAAKIYAAMLPDDTVLGIIMQLNIEPQTLIEIMMQNKQWKTVIDFLKPVIQKENDINLRAKLEKPYASALTELGQYKEALPLLERLQTVDLDNKEIKWYYARTLEALGQVDKAKNIYSSLGAAGAYRLGAILEKEGNIRDAAYAFIKSSDVDSRWRGTRLLDEIGETDKALEQYVNLSKEAGINQDDAAYRAYVLITRKRGTGTDEILNLISKYPAWMLRLNKEPKWESITDLTYQTPEFLKRVEAYKISGRKNMAQAELAIGEKNAADISQKLALGDLYMSQENYPQAVVWGIRALKDQPVRRAYELAYQKPYNDQVLEAASKYNIDPYLLWALMREESYYRKDAVSRVGALGLMQLMPDTAKDIASRIKVQYNKEDLLKSEVNISFGAYYLHTLLDMFSGDMDKALAAYNGGGGNVKRWSSSGIGKTKQDFPTAIAFQETREYITKVMNSYYTYKWLYGGK